jgi:hypothetical protein
MDGEMDSQTMLTQETPDSESQLSLNLSFGGTMVARLSSGPEGISAQPGLGDFFEFDWSSYPAAFPSDEHECDVSFRLMLFRQWQAVRALLLTSHQHRRARGRTEITLPMTSDLEEIQAQQNGQIQREDGRNASRESQAQRSKEMCHLTSTLSA